MTLTRIIPGAALAALALSTTLAAQNPPAPARAARPGQAAAQAKPGEQGQGPNAARYLADNPQLLQLTPVQIERVRKVASRVDSLDAPLRAQMQQVTRGRQIREMPPADRRRAAPQLRDISQQVRANNATALDSISAILTPAQATRLETLREDFKQHREARQAEARSRMDSARARAPQRPRRP